jgi:hypothetical protein
VEVLITSAPISPVWTGDYRYVEEHLVIINNMTQLMNDNLKGDWSV